MRTVGIGVAALALAGCSATQSSTYAPVDEGYRRTDDGWVEPIGPTSPYGWDEFASFRFGERNMSSSVLPEGDGQLVLGLELWGAPRGAWLDLEFGFFAAAPWNGSLDDWGDSLDGFPDEEADSTEGQPFVSGTSTLEFSIGVRREFWLFDGHLRPFVSGGASAQRLRVFSAQGPEGSEDADGSLGVYAQAGVGWMFLNGGRIDVSYRWLDSESVEVAGLDTEADYDQWSIGFGFAF